MLDTNISKCQFTPIRCTQELFPCQLIHFPCKYLGVPLSVHRLNIADFQPLVDSVADLLPSWKAGLMTQAGRTTLAKVTLSAIPTHISIAVKVHPGALKDIDRLRRTFVWAGSDKVAGGRCLVAWSKITRPSELGGLGVLDHTMIAPPAMGLAEPRRTGSCRDCAAIKDGGHCPSYVRRLHVCPGR
jgi:hypothetical protein